MRDTIWIMNGNRQILISRMETEHIKRIQRGYPWQAEYLERLELQLTIRKITRRTLRQQAPPTEPTPSAMPATRMVTAAKGRADRSTPGSMRISTNPTICALTSTNCPMASAASTNITGMVPDGFTASRALMLSARSPIGCPS